MDMFETFLSEFKLQKRSVQVYQIVGQTNMAANTSNFLSVR